MTAKVFHAELWGKRQAKYDALNAADIENTAWEEIAPQKPFYLFKPQNIEMLEEYQKGWKITEVVPVNGVGMTTARDRVVIDFEAEPIIQRALTFRDSTDSDAELCRQLDMPMKKGWNIPRARELIRSEPNLKKHIKPILYRPFDERLIFYHDSLVWRTVKKIMRHMLAGENVALISARSNKSPSPDHFFCGKTIMETKCGERTTQSALFPIYLYPDPDHPAGRIDEYWSAGKGGRRPNLNPDFVKDMEEKLGLTFVSDGCGDLKRTFGPEDVFHYMYAVFHSPTYRSRYAEFLKIDFPRLPLTSDVKLFVKLSGLGADLAGLHLLESPALDNPPVRYPIKGDDTVAKGYPKYVPMGGRVHINAKQYFEPVAEEVWEFHVGGYQVCRKWLKDRRGRKLSYDDITHYRKVVVALGETIRLMAAIDAAVPAWPIK